MYFICKRHLGIYFWDIFKMASLCDTVRTIFVMWGLKNNLLASAFMKMQQGLVTSVRVFPAWCLPGALDFISHECSLGIIVGDIVQYIERRSGWRQAASFEIMLDLPRLTGKGNENANISCCIATTWYCSPYLKLLLRILVSHSVCHFETFSVAWGDIFRQQS